MFVYCVKLRLLQLVTWLAALAWWHCYGWDVMKNQKSVEQMKEKINPKKNSFIPSTRLLKYSFVSTNFRKSSDHHSSSVIRFQFFSPIRVSDEWSNRNVSSLNEENCDVVDWSQNPDNLVNVFGMIGKLPWEAHQKVEFPIIMLRTGTLIPNDSNILNIAKSEFSELCSVISTNKLNSWK